MFMFVTLFQVYLTNWIFLLQDSRFKLSYCVKNIRSNENKAYVRVLCIDE